MNSLSATRKMLGGILNFQILTLFNMLKADKIILQTDFQHNNNYTVYLKSKFILYYYIIHI